MIYIHIMYNQKQKVNAKSKPCSQPSQFFDGHQCILLVFMLLYTKPLYKKERKNEKNHNMVDTQKLSYYYYIHINHYYYLAVSNNLLTLPKNDETMLKSLRINNDLCYSYLCCYLTPFGFLAAQFYIQLIYKAPLCITLRIKT